MDKPIVIAAIISSFCLFIAIGLYFAQRDIETRNFTEDSGKTALFGLGPTPIEGPDDFSPATPEPQNDSPDTPVAPEGIPAEFHATELVENGLPKSIEFWTQADCPGDGSSFDYTVPSGYRVESCEYGETGSHNGCSDCTMAKILLIRDLNRTESGSNTSEKPEPPEIFKLDLSWSYTTADKIYAHIGYGYVDGRRAIYRLYRKIGGSGNWALRNDSETPTTAVGMADYDASEMGTDYYYYATAVIDGVESEPSAVKHIKIEIPKCNDTDGDSRHFTGVNYFVQGTVAGKTDSCLREDTLIEYFCSPLGGAANTQYQCANGCKSGACVSVNQ